MARSRRPAKSPGESAPGVQDTKEWLASRAMDTPTLHKAETCCSTFNRLKPVSVCVALDFGPALPQRVAASHRPAPSGGLPHL